MKSIAFILTLTILCSGFSWSASEDNKRSALELDLSDLKLAGEVKIFSIKIGVLMHNKI